MTDLRVDFSALVFMAEGDDGFSILQSIYLAEQGLNRPGFSGGSVV